LEDRPHIDRRHVQVYARRRRSRAFSMSGRMTPVVARSTDSGTFEMFIAYRWEPTAANRWTWHRPPLAGRRPVRTSRACARGSSRPPHSPKRPTLSPRFGREIIQPFQSDLLCERNLALHDRISLCVQSRPDRI